MRKRQQVDIDGTAPLRREFRVHSRIQEVQSRVHEVRLTFVLAGPQCRVKAESLVQADARTRQRNPLPIPETDVAAGELDVVEDAVESARYVVRRFVVARGV